MGDAGAGALLHTVVTCERVAIDVVKSNVISQSKSHEEKQQQKHGERCGLGWVG